MKNKIFILLLCIFSILGYAQCTPSATNPDSDGDGIADVCDYDDDNDGILDCDENLLNRPIDELFKINGSATKIVNREAQLTPDLQYQSGQIWSYGKVDFTRNFSISFQAYLGTKNDDGADGVAIVFHNDPAGVSAIGANGDGIGARGIQNGIVLELDTFYNSWLTSESTSDHGQIWRSVDQSPITTPVALPNLEDGNWHTVVVNWNSITNTLNYTVDGTLAGSYTGNVVNNFFGGSSKVHFGYTASTGVLSNQQRVSFPSSSACSLPFQLDTDSDGIPNHLDLDSDNDGCPDAIEGGASFTSSNLVNSSMSGGNAGATSGTFNQPVTHNLGNTVNATSSSASYGVPTVAGTGQTIGTSITANSVLAAGTASANQTISTGSTPAALSLTGATGSIQWQISTNNTTFTNISGATNTTYATGALTATRYYRAIVTSAGGCTLISNTVTINVVPPYDCTGKIYSLSSVTGEIRVFNTPDSSGVLGAVMNTTPHPIAISPAPNGPNALGYSIATRKFYYVINQNNGVGNTFVSYDPVTNIYSTLAGTTGYIYRGTVTNDGLGYYGLTSSNELKYYNITNNSWTSITDYYVDQNGNDLFTILSTYSGGDIAIDGNGDLWILAGTNSSSNTFLFRLKGPLPKTDLGATPLVLEQIVQKNIGSGPNGIAFNSAGELFITNSTNLFKLNTDFTISPVVPVSPSNGAGDLASCAFPTSPLSSVCYKDPLINGSGIETKIGITLQKRAGSDNPDNWPMVRKSGHIVLESNTQGFVITRIAKADLGNIANPQEGMMVYDTADKCLKIYSDNAWKCFNIPTCP